MNRTDELRRHLADAREAIRKGIALLEGSGAAAPPEGSVEGVLAGITALPTGETVHCDADPLPTVREAQQAKAEHDAPREMPQELKDLLAGPDDEPDEGIMAREPTRREHPDAGIVVEHLPPEYGEP